jgi:hypothetical protein
MDLQKTAIYTWKEIAAIKVATACFGLLIGAICSKLVLAIWPLFVIIGLFAGLWAVRKWSNKPAITNVKFKFDN